MVREKFVFVLGGGATTGTPASTGMARSSSEREKSGVKATVKSGRGKRGVVVALLSTLLVLAVKGGG